MPNEGIVGKKKRAGPVLLLLPSFSCSSASAALRSDKGHSGADTHKHTRQQPAPTCSGSNFFQMNALFHKATQPEIVMTGVCCPGGVYEEEKTKKSRFTA